MSGHASSLRRPAPIAPPPRRLAARPAFKFRQIKQAALAVLACGLVLIVTAASFVLAPFMLFFCALN